jgi:hypothetical protein
MYDVQYTIYDVGEPNCHGLQAVDRFVLPELGALAPDDVGLHLHILF